jgi:hypothetical protein
MSNALDYTSGAQLCQHARDQCDGEHPQVLREPCRGTPHNPQEPADYGADDTWKGCKSLCGQRFHELGKLFQRVPDILFRARRGAGFWGPSPPPVAAGVPRPPPLVKAVMIAASIALTAVMRLTSVIPCSVNIVRSFSPRVLSILSTLSIVSRIRIISLRRLPRTLAMVALCASRCSLNNRSRSSCRSVRSCVSTNPDSVGSSVPIYCSTFRSSTVSAIDLSTFSSS